VATKLWVPPRFAKAATSAKTLARRVAPKLVEAPGKKQGQPVGTWIGNLSDLRKVILLCPPCSNGFNYKRNRYYPDMRWPQRVQGKCDGRCQGFTAMGTAFYPEESLADSGGRLRPGQCLTPL